MRSLKQIVFWAAAAAVPATAAAQGGNFADVEVTAHHLAGNVHYLEGQGGNIGLSVGEDGVVMIDDQFAPLTEKILAAIRTLSDGPIRFVVNTHIHGDHTGGNENLGRMGIPILAHDNVRVRMSLASAPVVARPVLTYGDRVAMHLNGEEIEIIKAPPAHTDGDSYIFFRTSNVLHTGDVFRTGAFPVIDTSNGGTADGTIAALRLLLDLAGPDTIILPGHGMRSTEADVQEFLDMVVDVRNRVSGLINQGMTLEQIIAANPTAQYQGRGDPERFLTGLHASLTAD